VNEKVPFSFRGENRDLSTLQPIAHCKRQKVAELVVPQPKAASGAHIAGDRTAENRDAGKNVRA
jgi:hypothetical protein